MAFWSIYKHKEKRKRYISTGLVHIFVEVIVGEQGERELEVGQGYFPAAAGNDGEKDSKKWGN